MKHLTCPLNYKEWCKLTSTKKAIKIIIDDLYPKQIQLKLF